MHFYVDESGHTGPNLFDPSQPTLYYGVLSSPVDVDALAIDQLVELRNRVGMQRLHAADLGNGGLVSIAGDLASLQKSLSLSFDIFRVAKPDHAVICFFDQVFDSGMNPAMTWTGYATPLRYALLLTLAPLFDDGLAQLAWDARLERDDRRANSLLSQVCNQLLERIGLISDARARQLIEGTLGWAAKNPGALQYNAASKLDRLSVMPNVVGFQQVMMGMASRLNATGQHAERIVVDQQSQFNKAQKSLHEYYISASAVTLSSGPGLPELDCKGIPNIPIEFTAGTESCGLELVDVYLWAFRRAIEGRELAPELWQLVKTMMHDGITSEISLKAIATRWEPWFRNLPKPTPEEIVAGRELHALEEARRLKAMQGG